MIDVCTFPTSLKLANITPIYKNAQKGQWKITGWYVSCQISPKFKKDAFLSQIQIIQKFSKFQCGHMQGLSAQYCLIPMIEE